MKCCQFFPLLVTVACFLQPPGGRESLVGKVNLKCMALCEGGVILSKLFYFPCIVHTVSALCSGSFLGGQNNVHGFRVWISEHEYFTHEWEWSTLTIFTCSASSNHENNIRELTLLHHKCFDPGNYPLYGRYAYMYMHLPTLFYQPSPSTPTHPNTFYTHTSAPRPLLSVVTTPNLKKSNDIWVCPNTDHVCTRFFFVFDKDLNPKDAVDTRKPEYMEQINHAMEHISKFRRVK